MRNKFAKVSDPNKFISDPGSDEHILYKGQILPNGEVRLTEKGKESISEKINSYKMSTDISYIVSRLAVGDTSVLRAPGAYGDFTQMPKTLAEALQLVMDGQAAFDALDIETKNKFDNNFNQWFMTAGNKDWYEKMNINIEQPAEVKEEVIDNES